VDASVVDASIEGEASLEAEASFGSDASLEAAASLEALAPSEVDRASEEAPASREGPGDGSPLLVAGADTPFGSEGASFDSLSLPQATATERSAKHAPSARRLSRGRETVLGARIEGVYERSVASFLGPKWHLAPIARRTVLRARSPIFSHKTPRAAAEATAH
jgi:hypothetical protein